VVAAKPEFRTPGGITCKTGVPGSPISEFAWKCPVLAVDVDDIQDLAIILPAEKET